MAVAEEREGEGEVAQPQHHPEGPEAVERGEEEVQREEKTMFQVIVHNSCFYFTQISCEHISKLYILHMCSVLLSYLLQFDSAININSNY